MRLGSRSVSPRLSLILLAYDTIPALHGPQPPSPTRLSASDETLRYPYNIIISSRRILIDYYRTFLPTPRESKTKQYSNENKRQYYDEKEGTEEEKGH